MVGFVDLAGEIAVQLMHQRNLRDQHSFSVCVECCGYHDAGHCADHFGELGRCGDHFDLD